MIGEPGWRNGRRRGLKILWSESSVRVRVPPPATIFANSHAVFVALIALNIKRVKRDSEADFGCTLAASKIETHTLSRWVVVKVGGDLPGCDAENLFAPARRLGDYGAAEDARSFLEQRSIRTGCLRSSFEGSDGDVRRPRVGVPQFGIQGDRRFLRCECFLSDRRRDRIVWNGVSVATSGILSQFVPKESPKK